MQLRFYEFAKPHEDLISMKSCYIGHCPFIAQEYIDIVFL